MSTSLTPEQMKNIVRDHFEEFVNKRNAGVIRLETRGSASGNLAANQAMAPVPSAICL